MSTWRCSSLLLLMSLTCSAAIAADSPSTPDKVPYRTESGNQQLPWYQLKPGEFPPVGSEHRVAGELVEADFIHRAGQFRTDGTGVLVNFKLLPCATVRYCKTEVDLRDVPLGTPLIFCLYQDPKGAFTQVAAIEEKPGGGDAPPEKTEPLRKGHIAFLKMRGLPAWIEQVEGKKLTVTLFGDPASLEAMLKDEGIVPAQWASEHRRIGAAVANNDLRTYNPPVDQIGSDVLSFERVPTDRFGCSGLRWTIQPSLLLEGYRKGHVVRLFAHPSWKIDDMPFGERLYNETPGSQPEEEDPNQYSYRTDFGNESLPWYQLKPGEFPPYRSQHVVSGELLTSDSAHRSGTFRTDVTGEVVTFTMPSLATIMHVNAEAELDDLSVGTRYSFFLYPDEKGAFTRAAVIADDFTRLADRTISFRVTGIHLKEGNLSLAKQLDPLKDDKDHLVTPPDLGQGEFTVDEKTRVWKGDKQAALGDIAIGDQLQLALSGATPTSRGHCTDVWMGPETIKHATESQRARHEAFLKEHGVPGWVESTEGNAITVTFFTANRRDLLTLLNGDPRDRILLVTRADEQLHLLDSRVDKMNFNAALPEEGTFGTYCSSGVRWILASDKLPAGYQKGQMIRMFEVGWARKEASQAAASY